MITDTGQRLNPEAWSVGAQHPTHPFSFLLAPKMDMVLHQSLAQWKGISLRKREENEPSASLLCEAAVLPER